MSLEPRHVGTADDDYCHQRRLAEDRHALLVGVNEFLDPAFATLKYSGDDVLALGEILKSKGYRVVTLHDGAAEERLLPTRDNVEAALEQLPIVVGPYDLLWVHFTCHGTLVEGQPVLVTRETRRAFLATRVLPVARVLAIMRQTRTTRLVLTLDACHVGAAIRRDLADPDFLTNIQELAEGVALLAASTSQHVPQEWAGKDHGVFSYYLLSGLSGEADQAGKGCVTVNDLYTHAVDGLYRWSMSTRQRIREPAYSTGGLGDMILAARTPTEPMWQQIGIEMVCIPAGEFLYGEDKESVHLPEYWMSRTPVTNAQYRAFAKAAYRWPPRHWEEGQIPPGTEDHPVVWVSWEGAQAFCRWAGVRLPTEQEWEKGSRGTDGREYPWGNDWEDGRCNTIEARLGGTTPVTQYPDGASPYGLLDMAGNVWEWCQDWYDGRQGTRVSRGGSFYHFQGDARCACRLRALPGYLFDDLGFRVVVAPADFDL